MLRFLTIVFALMTVAVPAFAQSADCPDLTMLQKAAGYLTLLNVVKVLGMSIAGLGTLFFAGGIIREIVYHSRVLLEMVGYVVSIACIFSGIWLANEASLVWVVFIGCLLFAGTVMATLWIHDIKGEDPKLLSAFFMVVWGAVALYYNMVEVGFLSMMALMSLLGFSVKISGLSYGFGFKDRRTIPSGTIAALMVLALFIGVHLFVPEAPPQILVFKPGAFWVSSFVAFIGLLIMSSRYYTRGANYVSMQLITIIVYGAALGIGVTFGINPLAGMAGTFLVFYIAEKPFEIPQHGLTTLGLSFMMSGAVLYAGWWYGTMHLTSVTQYLTAHF